MKKSARILTIGLAIIVGMTCFAMGTEDVSAASKKPGKTVIKSVKATGQSTINVSWKKTKKASGYEVVQNGQHVQFVNGTSTTIRSLSPGKTYSYKVRAYKNVKKKQYFNKKTGKWQAKQPKKKFRGGKRTVYVKSYGKFSGTLSATTAGAQKAAASVTAPGKPAKVTAVNTANGVRVTADAVAGASGYRFYRFDYSTTVNTIRATQGSPVFNDTSVQNGQQVQYGVCAYKIVNGSQVFGTVKWGDAMTVNKSVSPTGGNQNVNGSLTVASYPSTMNVGETKYASFNKPCSGTITYKSSNASVLSVSAYGDNQTKLTANAAGTATITATFAPANGYSTTGNKTATFSTTVKGNGISTKGGTVYPSADGTFTVTKGENYTDAVCINGVNNPFSAIYNSFPTGTTFRLNANEFKIESANGNGQQTGHTYKPITNISNKSVARIMDDFDNDGGGLIFLAAGETNITFSNGKTIKFIVSGENVNMNNYVKYVDSFVYRNRNRSDYEFVQTALNEIWGNYSYDVPMDAFTTVLYKAGNCWGGNRLFNRMCVERGIEAKIVDVKLSGVDGWHRMNVVNVGGVTYYADATFGSAAKVFTTPTQYSQTWPGDVVYDTPAKSATKW